MDPDEINTIQPLEDVGMVLSHMTDADNTNPNPVHGHPSGFSLPAGKTDSRKS